MGATCFGLVEEVDALRDAVRPGIQGCGDAVRPGMQGCSKSPAGAIRRCSAGGVPQRLRRDAPQEVLRRRCTAQRRTAGGAPQEMHWRRYSPNKTGDQGGRPARSLRSSESAVTDEGKRDNRCERMFLREGQSSPGNLKTTGFPHSLLEEHQDLALLRSAQPVPQDWTTSTSGEQCRTQVPISAGSGDLRPTLDEENAPPLVQDQCAALHYIQQRYTVLVNVVTESLVFPQWFLATMPTIKCLHIPKLHLPSCYNQVRS